MCIEIPIDKPIFISERSTFLTTNMAFFFNYSSMIKGSTFVGLVVILTYISTTHGQIESDEPFCNPFKHCDISCELPKCKCPHRRIPGDILNVYTPQMIAFTISETFNKDVVDTVRRIFKKSRKNPNGVPIRMTFFASLDSTDPCAAKYLWEDGHEIGAHGDTIQETTDWTGLSYPDWNDQFNSVIDTLEKEVGIPRTDFKGMRAPRLQPGGNVMLKMASENFTYDSSYYLFTGENRSPNEGDLWPFTFDYPLQGTTDPDIVQCVDQECPSQCFPGLWEMPVSTIFDNFTKPCTYLEKCDSKLATKEDMYWILKSNFERNYQTDRAPLIINMRSDLLLQGDFVYEGINLFIEEMLDRPNDDVFILSLNQILEWVKNPVRLDDIWEGNFKGWKKGKARNGKYCSYQSGDGGEVRFFISGNALVIIEALFFSAALLVLYIKDKE